jgi:hypothetical protein
MKIYAIKLITGEELIGEVETETEIQMVIKNPLGIAIVRGQVGQPPNVGFAPFPIHAEQKSGSTIALKREHIVYYYVPAEDFITNYDQIFGTGIILPGQQQIITG